MPRAARGWHHFVATLLIVVGAINVIQGAVALTVPGFFEAVGTDMLVLGFAIWGGLLGLWGVLMVLAGLAVLSGRTWARVIGIVLASVNILAQLAFVLAMPVWTLVAIAINLAAIYGMTAGWQTASMTRSDEEDEAVYGRGRRAAHAAPRPAQSPEQTGTREQTGGREQTPG